jgi:hypothetical protein
LSSHDDIVSRFNPDLVLRNRLIRPDEELLEDLRRILRPLPTVVDEGLLMRFRRVASFLNLTTEDDDEFEILCSEPPPAVPVIKAPNIDIQRKVFDLGYKVRRFIGTVPRIIQIANTTLPKNAILVGNSRAALQNFLTNPMSVLLNGGSESAASRNSAEALRDSSIAASYRLDTATASVAAPILGMIQSIGAASLLNVRSAVAGNTNGGSFLYNATVQGMDFKQLLTLSDPSQYVREYKLREAEESREFRKRKPKVLFTSDHMVDGKQQGIIVGWKTIPGAAGYVVRRIDVVSGRQETFTLYNEELRKHYATIQPYVARTVLPFYGNRGENVIAFLDREAPRNSYVVYRVAAFQTYFESKSGAFIVQWITANPSAAQRRDIREQLERIDPGDGPDTVSPYPILAKVLLGDPRYDWILAGVNVRASVDRRDERSATRRYSYLNAQLDFLFEQMSKGKFVIPRNIDHVISNITNGVAAYGILQMLQELLRETGILYYFDGADPSEDGRFDTTFADTSSEGRFLGAVAAALDPETYSLDLRSFIGNVLEVIGGGNQSALSLPSAVGSIRSAPLEHDVPSLDNISLFDLSLRSDLGEVDGVHLDLATFDGMSRLLRTIRIITDLGPTRGGIILEASTR